MAVVIHPEVGLGDDGGEERGVAAESVGVDCGFGVGVHAAIEQPARDFEFIVVNAKVQQGCAGERCSVGCQDLVMTAELGRVGLFEGEGALEQVGVTAEMVFEEIDAAAEDGHRWRVGQLEAVLDVELEDTM